MTKSTPRILVVDDEFHSRDVLVRALRQAKYEAVEASNADEGEALANEGNIDLAIIDIMMPGRDGLSLCEGLKGNPETADIPLIVLSALDDTKTRLAAMKLGVVGFLSKPARRRQLLEAVEGQLFRADQPSTTDAT